MTNSCIADFSRGCASLGCVALRRRLFREAFLIPSLGGGTIFDAKPTAAFPWEKPAKLPMGVSNCVSERGTLGAARVAGNGQSYFWGIQINNRYKVTFVWLPSCETSGRRAAIADRGVGLMYTSASSLKTAVGNRQDRVLLRRRLGRDASHDPMQTFGQIRYLLRLQVSIGRLPSQKKSFKMAGDRLHVAFPAGFNRIQDFA
jgi:hypothetical protein